MSKHSPSNELVGLEHHYHLPFASMIGMQYVQETKGQIERRTWLGD